MPNTLRLHRMLWILLIVNLAGCQAVPPAIAPTSPPAATLTSAPSPAASTLPPTPPAPTAAPTLPPTTAAPTRTPAPTLTFRPSGPCALFLESNHPVITMTETEQLPDGDCQVHLPPVARYPGDRLGGYTLTYPTYVKAQASDWETLDFSPPWSLKITRTRTDLPLEQIEAARLPFEFISVPLIHRLEGASGRETMQLGEHRVAVVNIEIYGLILRHYFVLSARQENGQADLLVFTLHNYPNLDYPARRNETVEAEVEARIATLRFDPPDQPVIRLPAAPDLPVAAPVLPLGALVEGHNAEERLTVLAADGTRLGGYTPEKIGGNTGAVFAIGPWLGDGQPLPLLTLYGMPYSQQRIYASQGSQVLQEFKVSSAVFIRGAPAQPVIAYTTISGNVSNLYFGRLEDFPAEPVFTAGGGGGPYPYAIYARADQPLGVWFTDQPYGIGNWAFLLDSGLSYYEAASHSTREVLPHGRANTMALSPDYSTVAYASAEQQVIVLELATRQEKRFAPDPWVELAEQLQPGFFRPGEARFSPDNRHLAWIEAIILSDETVGWGERPRARLRVAELSQTAPGTTGQTLYNLIDASLSAAAGFEADMLQPIGWLDAQTLLLQASAFGQPDQVVLLAFHASDGSVTRFSSGKFLDFVYAKVP